MVENLATGYQVGKGWADKLIETPKPLTAAKQDDEEPHRADTEDAVENASSEANEGQISPPETVDYKAGSEGEELSEAPAAPQQIPARRRMRFRVAED